MIKMKRLFAAAAAGLIAVTSAVPAFAAEKQLTEVNLSVESPVAGNKGSEKPVVTTSAEGVTVVSSQWVQANDMLKPFKGTFAEGEEYGIIVNLKIEDGYTIEDPDFKITINNETVSANISADEISVMHSLRAGKKNNDSPGKTSTGDSTSDSSSDSTNDSGKNYDNSNNANGSIPTNEGNATFIIFGVVIGIVAVAGVAYFIYTRKKK